MTAPNVTAVTAPNVRLAQLDWDDQAPKYTAGWQLRYYDASNMEQRLAVNESKEATAHELAAAVEAAIGLGSTLTGTILVFRGGEKRGSIRFVSGTAKEWKDTP